MSDKFKKYLCIKVVMHEKFVNLKMNVLIKFHGTLIKALGACIGSHTQTVSRY